MTIHVLPNRKAPDAWRDLNSRGLDVNPKTGEVTDPDPAKVARIRSENLRRTATYNPDFPDGPGAA